MSQELIDHFQAYAEGNIGILDLLNRLPADETIGALTELLEEFYEKHYQG